MVETVKEDTKKFFEDLIKFYMASVLGTAKSVATLVEIEKKFPNNYLKLKEATFDPEKIDEILTSMSDEEKETFLLIFTRASIISRKLNELFDLNLEEKEKLVKEIRAFAIFVGNRLKELEARMRKKGESKKKERG